MTGALNVLAGGTLRRCARVCVAAFVALFALIATQPAEAAPCIKFPLHGPIVAPPPAGVSITCNTSTDRFALGTAISITTFGLGESINLNNSGNLFAGGTGISASAALAKVTVVNSGDIAAAGLGTFGISAVTGVGNLSLHNNGDIATAALGTFGISAVTGVGNLFLQNSGDIASAGAGVFGISAVTGVGNLDLHNSGDIAVTGDGVFGISAVAGTGKLTLENTGNISAMGGGVEGISAVGGGSALTLENSGNLKVKGGGVFGISAETNSGDISIENRGNLTISGNQATGISASTNSGGISLFNGGDVDVTGANAVGLAATGTGVKRVSVVNAGDVHATGFGIGAAGNTALIQNSGSVFGGQAGISVLGGAKVTIENSGSIAAGNNLAIVAIGSMIDVSNLGVITGSVEFIGKTVFTNQTGGLFEASSSDFGGIGVFHNEEGATVHTARDPAIAEVTSFTGLRQFENAGLISLVDGNPQDMFEIANCGCGKATFVGTSTSIVAIDVFLGGPGSPADNVVIDADVKGKTALVVNNTNPGNGATNKEGIPVVFVEGNVVGNQFYLKDGPIDAGLVAYDLFFTKTGSGFFELRTIPDGHAGSFLLPELTTASQDVFFATTETWFDRTADLRVLLNGGGPGVQASTATQADATDGLSFTPAIWARGGGTWLSQGDTAGATAYGKSYNFNLNRDLQIMNFESGLDLGKRDFLTSGDILVFGVLGGAINASLDYDNILRQFTYEGGEVGVYATYLKGGLFVDTLAKADFLQLDPRDVRGFPDKLDDTNVGGRVDAGYRFGGFNGGMFVEPLATIALAWANVEGFTRDGNSVEFDDDPNLRGRLGLRVGTSMEAWEGVTFEPFVIGSVWSTLSGTNSATLTSLGTTFPTFTDEATDVWGVVSTGVNFFNPGAQTTVFAQVDVSFADDLDGLGAKAGMRYNW